MAFFEIKNVSLDSETSNNQIVMKMALTEQYVLQQLKEKSSLSIYYWSAENSRGEIDLSFIFRICNTRIKNKVHKVVVHNLVNF